MSTHSPDTSRPAVPPTSTQTGEGPGPAPDGPDPRQDGSTVPPPRTVRFWPAGRVLMVVGLLIGVPLVVTGAWSMIVELAATWHNTTHTEKVAPAISLVADGAVEIVVDPDATQVSVQADARYAWDWQAPTYQTTSTADRLEISHKCGKSPVNTMCEAGLTVTMPPDTQLEVKAGYGPVVASDLTGPVDVFSGHGRVELSRIDGNVVVHSDYGRVEVSDVTGSATLSSDNGDVMVSGVGGAVIEARSGYGRVEVSDVTGSAEVSSDNGDVMVSGVGGDVEARSGYGRVEVVSVAGSVQATSSNGAVLVEDVLGDVTARSDYGSVTVYSTGVPVALDIASGYGSQTIEAATDPAAPTRVSIHSSNGDVSYLAPRAPSRAAPVVPDVVGMSQQDAVAALEETGFDVKIVAEGSADVAQGQVLRTDPAAGQRVKPGTVVTVVVAAGEGG